MIEIIIMGVVLILSFVGFILFSWKFWIHKREKNKAQELLKQIEMGEDKFATVNDDYYESFWDRYDVGWKIRRFLPWIIFIVMLFLVIYNDPFHIKDGLITASNQTTSINSNNSYPINEFLVKTFPKGIPTWFWIAVIGFPIWLVWRTFRRFDY